MNSENKILDSYAIPAIIGHTTESNTIINRKGSRQMIGRAHWCLGLVLTAVIMLASCGAPNPPESAISEMPQESQAQGELEAAKEEIVRLQSELDALKAESESIMDISPVSEEDHLDAEPLEAVPPAPIEAGEPIITSLTWNKGHDITMVVGESNRRYVTVTPDGGEVTYSSSGPEIATVDEIGNVVCKSPGAVTIMAVSDDLSVSYRLTVTEKLVSANLAQFEKANTFFAPTNLTITDWTTQAVAFHETGYEALILDAGGKTLGRITTGRVNAADSGYTSNGQGIIDAFNDYRGVARATIRQDVRPQGGAMDAHSNSSSVEYAMPALGNNMQVDIEEYRNEVIRLTNLEREKAGLPALEIDQGAMDFAQIRAQEISRLYSHTRPNGEEKSYNGIHPLENIYKSPKTPEAAISGWMNSPGHRGGILDSNIYAIGVGCYEDADGTMYWTQEFLW